MSSISPAIQRLTEILDRQHHCCAALLELLKQEQEAITHLALDRLTTIHPEKITVLEELHSLEEQRSLVTQEVVDLCGLSREDVTLRVIAERVSAPEAGRLLRLQDRLNQAILAVRDAGTFSSLLLAGSLGFIDQCLSLWRGQPSSVPLYSQAGQLQAAGAGGALLARKG